MVNEALGQGAMCWADVGGWLYEFDSIPGWNVEKLLDGNPIKLIQHIAANLDD